MPPARWRRAVGAHCVLRLDATESRPADWPGAKARPPPLIPCLRCPLLLPPAWPTPLADRCTAGGLPPVPPRPPLATDTPHAAAAPLQFWPGGMAFVALLAILANVEGLIKLL